MSINWFFNINYFRFLQFILPKFKIFNSLTNIGNLFEKYISKLHLMSITKPTNHYIYMK